MRILPRVSVIGGSRLGRSHLHPTMCGICGTLHFDRQRPVARRDLEAMAEAIRHRGPDDDGFHIGPGIGLAMRRLSIIDLNTGAQPIYSPDGSACIVYNGELYNYRELREALQQKGHDFRTASDTEVVLHAYLEWGDDCLQRFNGMFAFAIWDGGRLFIARDRIGEKPLYYYLDAECLVFGSEIKAILKDPGVAATLSHEGLVNFLAFGHAVAPQTIYKDIFKLLPGHFLAVEKGRVETQCYWDVPSGAAGTDSAALLDLLDDSVRRRMVADVPVGAFLSGGVDSSAIVALMQRHSGRRVKTFSLGFDVGGAYDERGEARRAAEALGTEHLEMRVGSEQLIDTLDTLVYHYDEPFGDAAGLPIYLLSRFAREHVKVALAGDGADELFGGYRRYAVDRLAPYYQLLPERMIESWIPRAVMHLPRLRRAKRALRTLPIRDPAIRYSSWLELFSPEMRRELLLPATMVNGHDPAWPYPHYYEKLAGADALNRKMYVDLKTWLPDVYMEKTDKASMASGLEVRLPFLDHRLVELAFRIPGSAKIRGRTTKHILKEAVRGLIPDAVLKRPKHGFAVPTDPWFRGPARGFVYGVLLDEATRRRGYFDMDVIERMWKEHADGRHVWDTQLWLLLNFELWHRRYLD